MSEHSWPFALRFDRPQFFSPLWHRPYPGLFNFLGLPTDIRIMIYEEAFAEDSLNCRSDGSSLRVDFERKFRLARANKQIYNEALPLLYRIHAFKFKVWRFGRPNLTGIYDLEGIYLHLKEAPQDMLGLITDMHICLDEACVEEDAASGNTVTIKVFGHISHACTRLRSLHIKTQRLARPMYQKWTGHGYRFESPPYRRAMAKVLWALAQRLPNMEFQVADDTDDFEMFLCEVAPFEYWGKKRNLGSSGLWEARPGSGAHFVKIIGASTISDNLGSTSSDEALTYNEGSTTNNKKSTVDGEECIMSNADKDCGDYIPTDDVNSDSGEQDDGSHQNRVAEVTTYHTGNESSNSMDKQMPAAPSGNGLRWPPHPAMELQAMTIDYFSRSAYIDS